MSTSIARRTPTSLLDPAPPPPPPTTFEDLLCCDVIGCVVGAGLIAKFLMWLARMLRELSRLGSKRMPPVEAEEEEESRPSKVHLQSP